MTFKGFQHSEAAKNKMRESQQNVWAARSVEERVQVGQAMGTGQRGKRYGSEALANKKAAQQRPEVRAKKRAALLGRKLTPAQRIVHRAALQRSEVRANARARTLRQWEELSAEERAKQVEAAHVAWSGAQHTSEAVQKIAEAMERRVHDGMRFHHTDNEHRLALFLLDADFDLAPQVRFGPYCVDFYEPNRHIAFEADSYWHTRPGRPEKDAKRDAYLLAEHDLPVLRFGYEEILAWTADAAEVAA